MVLLCRLFKIIGELCLLVRLLCNALHRRNVLARRSWPKPLLPMGAFASISSTGYISRPPTYSEAMVRDSSMKAIW